MKCVSVEFKPYDKGKGMMSETTHEKPMNKAKGASMMPERERVSEHHATMEEAHAHLTKMLGHTFGAEKEGKSEEGPGKEPEAEEEEE